jgi:MHS family proline/betaine transporter-like MFS transporter
MAAANIGTFLGGLVAYGLRLKLSDDALLQWGWRIPFLSGILISFCGIYLKYFCTEDEGLPGHGDVQSNDCHAFSPETMKSEIDDEIDDIVIVDRDADDDHNDKSRVAQRIEQVISPKVQKPSNPLRLAFSQENRRSLLASAMVPLLWSGGFYLSFVWMAIFMEDLIYPPVESAFLVNSCGILLLGIWFPLAGALSDMVGRRLVMTAGGIIFGCGGPIVLILISRMAGDQVWVAFCSQIGLGISLSMWGAPMCAWLVEAFDPQARLTSVSIGYNLAQALAGGFSPFLATLLTDELWTASPGILLTTLATLSLIGLWFVAPRHDYNRQSQEDDSNDVGVVDLELTEIT